jgi:DNA-binding LytR/AlgR family response regulator
VDIFVYHDPLRFLDDFAKKDFNVVFMDIELPSMNGMKTAAEIRKTNTVLPIIFVTNAAKYALQGYSVGAMDYFLKPVGYYEMRLRLDQIRRNRAATLPVVSISIPGMKVQVLSSEIYYVEIMDHELTWHTVKGDFTVSRGESLKNIEKRLSALGFCRCSSCYLVNLKYCTELRGDEAIVAGNALKVSRALKKNFVTALSETIHKSQTGI